MCINRSISILVVNDHRTMQGLTRNLLKRIHFNNVAEAWDGSEALHKMRAGQFGLIISDWNMEPMTGLQLLREVRADHRLKATPFIMTTAESKAENIITAQTAGVSDYIVGPFNAETLQSKIESALEHPGGAAGVCRYLAETASAHG